MRKFVSGIGIVLILFGFTTSAYAQTTATRPGQIKREVVKERVETRKEIIADRKENITTKLDGLKIRIASKEASLKLRLNKLQERVSNAASNGKDAASANAAISSARAKIASASAAVASQSAKEYTLSVSSESAAKAEIKATRDAFHGDWQSVRALLIDAKQAVANAIRVAATTLGGDNP